MDAEQWLQLALFIGIVTALVPLLGGYAAWAQSKTGMPLLEAIEQRAIKRGVEVESRVSRGRT